MNFLKVSVFLVLVVLASADKKAGGPALHQEHYDAEGHHNPDFDSESLFGDDSDQFKNMDEDEIREKLSEYVDKMDANHDGSISREELINWVGDSYRHMDTAQSKTLYSDFDSDHDGKIEWSEALKFLYGYSPDELKKNIAEKNEEALRIGKFLHFDQQRYSSADIDKDQALTMEEFNNFVHPQSVPALSDIETNKTMFELDTNRDNKIDFEEYVAGSGPEPSRETEAFHFKELDTNGDGSLDFEEVRNWMIPDYAASAKQEVEHIIKETDSDSDGLLSKEEILDKSELFTGSHIVREHDEL